MLMSRIYGSGRSVPSVAPMLVWYDGIMVWWHAMYMKRLPLQGRLNKSAICTACILRRLCMQVSMSQWTQATSCEAAHSHPPCSSLNFPQPRIMCQLLRENNKSFGSLRIGAYVRMHHVPVSTEHSVATDPMLCILDSAIKLLHHVFEPSCADALNTFIHLCTNYREGVLANFPVTASSKAAAYA
jgi:hypothetical protein